MASFHPPRFLVGNRGNDSVKPIAIYRIEGLAVHMVTVSIICCLNPLLGGQKEPASFTALAVNLKGSSVAIAEEIK